MSQRIQRSHKRNANELAALSSKKRRRKTQSEIHEIPSNRVRSDETPQPRRTESEAGIVLDNIQNNNRKENNPSGSLVSSSSVRNERERAEMRIARLAAARKRIDVKKRAVEEQERLQLNLIDEEFQEKMCEIEERNRSKLA